MTDTPILRLRISGSEAHINRLTNMLRGIPSIGFLEVSQPYRNRDNDHSRVYVTIVLSERTASK